MSKLRHAGRGGRPDGKNDALARKSPPGTTTTPLQAQVIDLQQKTGNQNVNRILARDCVCENGTGTATTALPGTLPTTQNPGTTGAGAAPAVAAPTTTAAQDMWQIGVTNHIRDAKALMEKPAPTRADFTAVRDHMQLAMDMVHGVAQRFRGTDDARYDKMAALNNSMATALAKARARLGEFQDSSEFVTVLGVAERRAVEASNHLN